MLLKRGLNTKTCTYEFQLMRISKTYVLKNYLETLKIRHVKIVPFRSNVRLSSVTTDSIEPDYSLLKFDRWQHLATFA